jgi:hypothetical protein
MSSSSGVKTDAFAGYGTAAGQGGNAYNTIAPIYTQMAMRPQGLTPQQMANALTASGQSLGGSLSALVGQGALQAARTGNAGAYQAAMAEAARNAAQQGSQNALQLQLQNAQLQREQQAQGLRGLQDIYQLANQAGTQYLNIANQARPTFWQNMANVAGSTAIKALMAPMAIP